MQDVVFAFPPARGNRGFFKPHLGVAYLQSSLQRHGIRTEQYLQDTPGTPVDVARDILTRKPGIVGFTVYDSNMGLALRIAKCIKAESPGTRIVFGGPTPTFSSRRILQHHDVVDFCTIGEMEEAGPAIIGSMLQQDSTSGTAALSRATGVAFRDDGDIIIRPAKVHHESHARAKDSLDSLDSPYLTGILSDGRAGILTGRGCNQHCTYCSFAAIGHRRVRLHSIGRVLDELKVIADWARAEGKQAMVGIHDDTFTIYRERAKRLCAAIRDSRLNIRLTCITRADTVDDELLRLMKEAGFVALAFGLESAEPAVLRAIGKVRPPNHPDTTLKPEKRFLEQVRTSVQRAHELGFLVGVSIILGLPAEQARHAEKTVAFVRDLPVNYYMHNILLVFEGTPLWDSHQRHGIKVKDDPLGLPATTDYPHDPYAIAPTEKCTAVREARFVQQIALHHAFGCNAIRSLESGFSTIIYRGDELEESIIRWITLHLAVGGILIQVYSNQDPAVNEEAVRADRYRLMARLSPARYFIQLVPQKDDGNGACTWSIFSEVREPSVAYDTEINEIRYCRTNRAMLDWTQGNDPGACLCDLACEDADPSANSDQLPILLKKLTLKQIISKTPPPAVQYPGRFLSQDAPCRKLGRIEIDAAGRVYCCPYIPAIGSVDDCEPEIHRRHAAILAAASSIDCGTALCPAVVNFDQRQEMADSLALIQAAARIPYYLYDALDEAEQS